MLSAESERELRLFTTCVNRDNPGVQDWQRFYEFIVGCHRRGDRTHPANLRARLQEFLRDEEALRFALFYEQGLQLLTIAEAR
jgi:hypothetical protein